MKAKTIREFHVGIPVEALGAFVLERFPEIPSGAIVTSVIVQMDYMEDVNNPRVLSLQVVMKREELEEVPDSAFVQKPPSITEGDLEKGMGG